MGHQIFFLQEQKEVTPLSLEKRFRKATGYWQKPAGQHFSKDVLRVAINIIASSAYAFHFSSAAKRQLWVGIRGVNTSWTKGNLIQGKDRRVRICLKRRCGLQSTLSRRPLMPFIFVLRAKRQLWVGRGGVNTSWIKGNLILRKKRRVSIFLRRYCGWQSTLSLRPFMPFIFVLRAKRQLWVGIRGVNTSWTKGNLILAKDRRVSIFFGGDIFVGTQNH